jgi:hypothetical protein
VSRQCYDSSTTFIPVLINESTFTQAPVDEAADEAASNRSLIL